MSAVSNSNFSSKRSKGSVELLVLLLLLFAVVGFFVVRGYLRKQQFDYRKNLIPQIFNREGKDTTGEVTKAPSDTKKDDQATPLAMAFILNPDVSKVCDYPIIGLGGRNLRKKGQQDVFDPTFLDKAKGCGTKVIVSLNDKTERVLQDDGTGLDLEKFREITSFFKGKIDSYVDEGVIIANGVVDEPHDCNNDWGGVCPKASEVDEASKISKEYWPKLETAVNTVPTYIKSENYTWVSTDIIQFQYAFHKYKGDYEAFAKDAASYHNQGKFRKIAWGLQVKSGGCSEYQGCSMTPDQVKQVAEAMCATDDAEWIGYVFYDATLLQTSGMDEAIEYVKDVCS